MYALSRSKVFHPSRSVAGCGLLAFETRCEHRLWSHGSGSTIPAGSRLIFFHLISQHFECGATGVVPVCRSNTESPLSLYFAKSASMPGSVRRLTGSVVNLENGTCYYLF